MGTHEQTGIAGCFSVDEYESDVIKKHERTRRDKEDDRTRHILELRAQTGVVFLTYKSEAAVDAIAQRVTRESPLFDFTAQDGVHHTLWRASAPDGAALVAAFAGSPPSTSPTVIIAPPAPHGLAPSSGGSRIRQEADKLHRGRVSRATRCRSFPTTASSRIWRDGRRTEFRDQLRSIAPVSEGPPEPRRKGEVVHVSRWTLVRARSVEDAARKTNRMPAPSTSRCCKRTSSNGCW